jgi:hypothetical protein
MNYELVMCILVTVEFQRTVTKELTFSSVSTNLGSVSANTEHTRDVLPCLVFSRLVIKSMLLGTFGNISAPTAIEDLPPVNTIITALGFRIHNHKILASRIPNVSHLGGHYPWIFRKATIPRASGMEGQELA